MESRMIVTKYKPFVVAVTGSVGKTSAKDAIYCVLKGDSRYVRKSEKSMNSDIGLPLTVIGVPNAWRNLGGWLSNIWNGFKLVIFQKDYPDCLVLEIGADHPNDIKKIAKWLHPDIVVITKVSKTPVHVEFFDSPEQVFREKATLAEGIKAGGTLVLFADDEKVMSIAEKVKDKNAVVVSYGLDVGATVRGVDFVNLFDEDGVPKGISFVVNTGGQSMQIKVDNVLGRTHLYPLLSALAVGRSKGIKLETIVERLSVYKAPKGRMNIIRGINGSTIIDDTYNSSPDATSSALSTLKELRCSGSKIAVLGDMMELGKYSADEHRNIGKEVSAVVDQLVTVGPRSRIMADEAERAGLSPGSIHSFDNSEEAIGYLPAIVKNGDLVLVKGSQSVRMEKIVKVLLREPGRASELLVRQEKEWLNRG